MKVLLTAINAKYIHSNLAVYSLKAAAREFEEQVELAEFTINHRPEVIFGEIYRKKPDLLLFSCYIWNRREVLEIAENIRKVLPDTVIWAGGPEVSWDAELFLRENPQFDGVMIGEGEQTFYRLLQYYDKLFALRSLAGPDNSAAGVPAKPPLSCGAAFPYSEPEEPWRSEIKPPLSRGATFPYSGPEEPWRSEIKPPLSRGATFPYSELEEIPGIAWRVAENQQGPGCEVLGKPGRECRSEEPGTGNLTAFPVRLPANSAGEDAPEGTGPLTQLQQNPPAPPERTLDALPFVYHDLQKFENRIIYYESSRGCPFSCSYCLSSLEKRVRFRSLELVKKELAFFLEHQVRQVKFVDRTFNCRHSHAMEIWRFLLEHDNGVTNFHFEISADLLTEEELTLLAKMRPGLVQLEIGVQTVNPEALAAIHRTAPFEKIAEHVRRIAASHNIHQHLDLIAGLPFEGYESFGRSFDAVYALHPQELQLGFLKVLRGSEMQKRAGEYGIVYRSEPPYEVLQTRWISCGELLRLKEIEEMLEVYYNSHQFDRTIGALELEYGRPFALYEALASFYRVREDGQQGQRSYTRMQRLELLREFVRETLGQRDLRTTMDQDTQTEQEQAERKTKSGKVGKDLPGAKKSSEKSGEQRMLWYDRLLVQDLYLRENAKTRPAWAGEQEPLKDRIIEFYKEEEQARRYLPHYQGRTWKQLMKMTHLEYEEEGKWLLFDYARRDPLNYAAAVTEILINP